MEEDKDGKLQILVSLEGGLVASVQVFRSQNSAERF